MASSKKNSRFEFEPWAGAPYVIDPNVAAEHFYYDPVMRAYHIGAGTDLPLRLFWLNLTVNDRKFLKAVHIACDE